jgi:4-amino-4-deoxy-L-arabinose transferase-like glycosyltransferase
MTPHAPVIASIRQFRAAPFALASLIVVGLVVRLFDLTNPPLDFHPSRQLFSAVKARAMYYAWFNPEGPGWMRDFSISHSTPVIEPPLTEVLTAVTYALTGEHLWIPRVYSSLFWVAGAFAVFSLGRRSASQVGGLVSAAAYLFLPFAVVASRSFQPDPLMAALTVAFPWALMRWWDSRTVQWAIASGLIGGMAILVKSVAVFFVGGMLVALCVALIGARRAPRERHLWLILALVTLPAATYAFYGVFMVGTLESQFGGRFIPSLLADPLHYLRWAMNVTVATSGMALLGILGTALIRDRPVRTVLVGWWVGYLFYSLTFTYHTATHDYYQLPLIPLVSIAIAPLADGVMKQLRSDSGARPRLAALALVTLVAASVASVTHVLGPTVRRPDFRAQEPLWSAVRDGLRNPDGEMAAPVVGLTQDYGLRASYWGWFDVEIWPSTADLAYWEMSGLGRPTESFHERFAALTDGKRYFLVTSLSELRRQPELAEHLAAHYQLSSASDAHLIYDLSHEK